MGNKQLGCPPRRDDQTRKYNVDFGACRTRFNVEEKYEFTHALGWGTSGYVGSLNDKSQPPYRTPELFCSSFTNNSCIYTPAIDIWALGCIFAEMLQPVTTGKSLFEPGDYSGIELSQLRKILKVIPKPSQDDTLEYIEVESDRRYFRMHFGIYVSEDDDDDEYFEKHLQEMPWLAVPFSDKKTTEMLTKAFRKGFEEPCFTVLDQDDRVVNPDGVDMIKQYGAEAYPFTLERLEELNAAQSLESLRWSTSGKKTFQSIQLRLYRVSHSISSDKKSFTSSAMGFTFFFKHNIR